MARSYTLQSNTRVTAPDFAAELNPEQLAAVTAPPGPALVIAGAGSGKTRALTFRVAWLLSQGVPASSILLLTFTNKAAREMLERVAQIAPTAAEGIWGGTFHSIGNRILRRHAEELGFRQGFSILDRDDQEELLEAVIVKEGLRTKEKNFPKAGVVADLLSLSTNTCETIGSLIIKRYRYMFRFREEIEAIAVAYEGRKRENNAFDFDDLLAKPLELFRLREDIAQPYQNRFLHILVDEYQDTNLLQAHLIDLLAQKHRNLMVVGDDAQSIYSWRGADSANILEFPQRYPGTRIFKIETNYRSVPGVLELANAAIAGNEKQFQKQLVTVRPAGASLPALVPLGTNNEQAAFIAQRILELSEEGIAFSEMAVLYRAHFHAMELQMEFTRRGIPFQITSGIRFFEQAHIKDVASYMKFVVNPSDEIAFKRIVRMMPGVGGKSADVLWQQVTALLGSEARFAALHQVAKVPSKAQAEWVQLVHTLEELAPDGIPIAPQEMIQVILLAGYDEFMQTKLANYENRREDLEGLKNYATSFESAQDFLAQLALLSSLDSAAESRKDGEQDDAVTLSSIHQAKGLEWRVVFIPWLTDGMFPGSRSLDKPDALEEERRLFYVAVTRCKDELYLTYPEFRAGAGYGESFQRPSRFLSELPEHVYEPWDVQSGYSMGFPHKSARGQETADAHDEPF